MDQIFVDTKFEFGYVTDKAGKEKLIYMDEVGTPDSSRIWDGAMYKNENKVVENSKEFFRQMLMKHHRVPSLAILWPHHMNNIRRERSQAAHSTDGAYPCSTFRPTLKRRSSPATPETDSRIRDETMTPTHDLRRGARHRYHNQHHNNPEIRPRQP